MGNQRRKVKSLTLFLLLFSVSTISAITIYSGESVELELEKPFQYYSIVGNSTPIELEIIQNGNNITITLDKHMKTDSFEIVFFDIEKEVITVYQSSGGGGGGGTRTVYKNNTEYVEVDNYVDREVIKEVPGEEKIVEKEIIIKKSSIWGWIVLIILFSVLGWIGYQYYISERRLENE